VQPVVRSTLAMPTLDEINRFRPAEFSRAFGAVYEHSAWIAERAFALRPATGFASRAAVHAALVATVQAAGADEQLALLDAHPELAGKEAEAGALTAASQREQSAAGLIGLTSEETQRLRALNARYRDRFGFPFIIAARNNTRAAIFGALEARLHNTRAMEINNALMQVGEIARLRVFDLIEA